MQKAVERVLGVTLVPERASAAAVFLPSIAEELRITHGGQIPPEAYWSLGEGLLFERLQIETPAAAPSPQQDSVLDYILKAYMRARAEEGRARRMPSPDKEAGMRLMSHLRALLAGYVRMAIEDPDAWAFPPRQVALPNGALSSVPVGPLALVPTLMNLSPADGPSAISDWTPDARFRATQPQTSKRARKSVQEALAVTAGWATIPPNDVRLFLSDLVCAAGVSSETPFASTEAGGNQGLAGQTRFEDLAPVLGPAITLIAQRVAGPLPPSPPPPPHFPGSRHALPRQTGRRAAPGGARATQAGLAPQALQAAVQAGDVRSVLAHLLAGQPGAPAAGPNPSAQDDAMDVDGESEDDDDEDEDSAYDDGYGTPSSIALSRTEAIMRTQSQTAQDSAGPSAQATIDGFALDSLSWRPFASVLVALSEDKILAEMVSARQHAFITLSSYSDSSSIFLSFLLCLPLGR